MPIHAKKPKGYSDGGRIKETKRMHGGWADDMGPTGPTGYSNRNKSSDMSGGQRKGPEGYGKYQEQAQNQKGVHTPVSGVTDFPGGKGTSRAGKYTKETYGGKPLFSGKDHPAKEEHHRVLGEMRSDKTDRRNLAEGGDVEPLDEPMQDDDHEELESTLAGELLHAMEKKDKKGVADAIEALVLQCMNKGGM